MATGTLNVVDYSFSRIDHAAAMARGVVGAVRYLYGNGKGLTAPEVALFRSSGLKLALDYEAAANDFVGYGAGAGHAVTAERFAVALALGGQVIIFNADFDVQPSQFYVIRDAINGALSVKGRGKVAIYGHANLIDYLHAIFGDAIYYFQTYAWSGGRLSAHADLYQFLNGQNFAGGQVDYDQITGRTFWAIGSNGTTASSGTATPITEDDMPLNDDDVKKVADAVILQMRQQMAPTGELFGRTKQAVTAVLLGQFSGPGKTIFDRVRQAVGTVMDRQPQAAEAQASADAAQAQIDLTS